MGLEIAKILALNHRILDFKFIEEEFRSQNGLNAPLPLTGVRINQSGIQTRDFLVDHQIFNLVGVLNPVIHPPVGKNSLLNSVSGSGAFSPS
jgi:hypothetical protein